MNSVKTKTMFSEVVNAAAKNKRQIAVNLSEVEKRVAEKAAQTPSLNRTQFEAGIDAVKNSSKELAVPSAGTLRAYAGIDQPIVSRFPSEPLKPKV